MTFLYNFFRRLQARQRLVEIKELRRLARDMEKEAQRHYAAATEYRRQALELENNDG